MGNDGLRGSHHPHGETAVPRRFLPRSLGRALGGRAGGSCPPKRDRSRFGGTSLEEARVPVDVEAIKELIRIVDQSDIAELKWENKDSRIILRKAAALAKGGAPAAPVTPPAAVAVGGGGPEDAAQAVVATS